ncbi:MAG: TssQ family T6SS-associated lipoprotein [Betaproteobacteria bacterium]
MIRTTTPSWAGPVNYWLRIAASLLVISIAAGCAAPPQKPSAPTAEEIAKQQRAERAQVNLGEGMKKYDSGNYEEAINSFLLALDSGLLTLPEQVNARKHMAFVHCLSGREANCKEEFEKVIILDPKFDLSPAETGHPIWGPIYRLAKTEYELRKSGRALPTATVKPLTAGEKLLQDGMKHYEDADYHNSVKSFQDALKETLTDANRIAAHKFLAFSFCLTNRTTLCRAEFEAIFKIDENFDLSPAEAGHPAWGPSFRTVKAKRKPAPPKK